MIELQVNGETRQLDIDPQTPLLYALRNDLGLKGAKYGCGTELCGACKVLVDGVDVPCCQLPVGHVAGLEITTVEGLAEADALHPLQEAFLEEQAAQCGYCTAGMIIAAQGLLNRVRYPSDDEIRAALSGNLCRCGVYDRVRRAIKLRIGRMDAPNLRVIEGDPLEAGSEDTARSPSLAAFPLIDDWIAFNEDRSVNVYSGKAELGQGIATALAQIAAEELDIALDRIRVVMADTQVTPDEGGTTGSRSLETSGVAIRAAAATARELLLALAFEQLDSLTPASELRVLDGVIVDERSGRRVDYWELLAGKRHFDGKPVRQDLRLKSPTAYTFVGRSEKRLDLQSKISGADSYVHDLSPPGMLHARVVQLPGYHARLDDFDLDAVLRLPGVLDVVQDGQFIAVISAREEQAQWAAEKARDFANWRYEAELSPAEETYADLLSKPAQTQLVIDGAVVDDAIPDIHPPEHASYTLGATYTRPFQMHASLGPSAALALWRDGRLTIWSHTQAAYVLQGALAQVLGMDAAQIRVIHAEGAGCYGHNGADDAALDAALVARAMPGKPISLKWTRWDEHAWEPYGPAMALKLRASLSNRGEIIDWNHDVWSYAHSTRPALGLESSGLLAAWHLAEPFTPQQPRAMGGYHSGAHRNADPIYALPRVRIARHAVADSPLRVSALRSLGAYANIFAIESFMDELALAAAADPLEFRLRHLRDERASAVLLAAAEQAGWSRRAQTQVGGEGWGMALAQYKNLQCYCAIVVKLAVHCESGEIDLQRVVIAADAGQVVNPDGLNNQLEGGFTQAASWTLYEAVKFDRRGVTSVDWETYPILPFSAAPRIETVIVNRAGLPFLGAGEAAQNPTPAAIANAVYDAVGLRLRDIPFTPDKVLAGLTDTPQPAPSPTRREG